MPHRIRKPPKPPLTNKESERRAGKGWYNMTVRELIALLGTQNQDKHVVINNPDGYGSWGEPIAIVDLAEMRAGGKYCDKDSAEFSDYVLIETG